jgi:hypothetical protein
VLRSDDSPYVRTAGYVRAGRSHRLIRGSCTHAERPRTLLLCARLPSSSISSSGAAGAPTCRGRWPAAATDRRRQAGGSPDLEREEAIGQWWRRRRTLCTWWRSSASSFLSSLHSPLPDAFPFQFVSPRLHQLEIFSARGGGRTSGLEFFSSSFIQKWPASLVLVILCTNRICRLILNFIATSCYE